MNVLYCLKILSPLTVLSDYVEALGYQTVSLCAEGVKQMVGGEGE